ncbi:MULTISPECIES: ABC transporter ATP-binding protein [unclassified Janthinobacterium]|uniref:ABC transporter ATP-binding protein n=1 Tax=unclassified Janthinobacterium TaxID=2610881 RepID=UPI0025AF3406|nr:MULTISPECIES: ABC transporter ATP-binding protein [unclassified Janthinobacterium]MDN2716650.1 ABC transporter ATP-binding protein [Janthinobacterium sp. SUN120]MDO8052204.1 ABC transporter ATP-binding protein [Janthinobacterium sp. SUN211]
MRFEKTFSNLIGRLWQHIGRSRRRQFWLLLGLTILASFAEIVSIGSVLPFIGALTNPEKIFDSSAAAPMIQFMGLENADQLLLPLTIIFSVAALLSGLLRIFSLKFSVKVSFEVGSELSNNVYRKTLYQPYATHIARNSSEVVNVIWVKISEVIFYILMPGLTLISSIAMIIAILFVLCYVIPGVALGIIACFGLIYAFIIKISRRHLKESSRRIATESNNVIKSLQEGLGGIRDILIDGSQESFCAIYRETDRILRTAQGSNQFISQSPRFAMESMGTVLIAGLAYVLSQRPDGITNAIPILAALALGLQRLLPALQQAYNSWSLMQGAHASLQDALDLLDQPMLQNTGEEKIAPISFENDISLKKVSFRYNSESPWIFEDVDLEVKKGSRVGFIGGTGSGKSTMIDIIMGLLDPARGALEIDGKKISSENRRAWQSRIAHVPQTVFLTDNSIEENIAFGIPREKISYERVKLAAEQAQLAETIEQWPEGYRTVVGERGIQLSGGQRQRIGIARALYKRADVIVFDEATSALDTETEMAVMLAIESLSKDITILIIAHRLNTLKNCHKIVEVRKEGIFIKDMNFNEVIGDFS